MSSPRQHSLRCCLISLLIAFVVGATDPAEATVPKQGDTFFGLGEPNDDPASATLIACPFGSIEFFLDPPTDPVDYYRLAAPGRSVIQILVIPVGIDEIDGRLVVLDSSLSTIASDDPPDSGSAYLEVDMPDDGVIFIVVSSPTSGGYRMAITCELSTPQAGDFLVVSGAEESLIDVPRLGGSPTYRAEHGALGIVVEAEFAADGTLIGALADTSTLIDIDPNTGDEVPRCIHDPGTLHALEFVDDVLYGSLDSELVIVGDPVDGLCALTYLGPTGYPEIGGLAYDPYRDTLYGCTGGPGPAELVSCDRSTGECTPIAAMTSVSGNDIEDCAALEFGVDRLLYGGMGPNSPDAGLVVRVSPIDGDTRVLYSLSASLGVPAVTGLTAFPDNDGVPDIADNCLVYTNPGQRDDDGDDIGNACDPDVFNDCRINFLDLFPVRAAFFSTLGNPGWNPVVDFNEDNVVNFVDLGRVREPFLTFPFPWRLPSGLPEPPCHGPDLTILLPSPTVTFDCGGQFCLEVTVRLANHGSLIHDSFSFSISTDNGLSDTFFVSGLEPTDFWGPRTITITLPPGDDCYNPVCQVTAVVDPDNMIPEEVEDNNTDTRSDQ